MIATIITCDDVALAQREAEVMEWEVAQAWEDVEQATRTAQVLEARTNAARERARRLGFQVGFRKVEAPPRAAQMCTGQHWCSSLCDQEHNQELAT
jgi:hypothetical protein